MKVLVIASTYPAPDNPQAGIFVHRQTVNLVRSGVECHVLAFRPAPPPFPKWLLRRSWINYFLKARSWPRELDGVPVDVVFYERTWSKSEDVVPAIGRALVEHVAARPDLQRTDAVYAHWYWTSGASALALRERFGWPVAAIARGSEMHDWHEVNAHCRPYVERVIREADVLLANCEHLRNRADEIVHGSAERIEIVYNGCDAERFRPADDRNGVREGLGIRAHEKLLLFCGDVCARKGVLELAQAWREFSGQHDGWRLCLVGQVIDPALATELRRSGAEILGRQSSDNVLRWMQAADAYIQPSRLEGLANATMEAMAVGLPVITTDTCGQSELVRDGENGWLVPTSDIDGLARALAEMAADPEGARAHGAAARATIVARFDPRVGAGRLAEALRRMVDRQAVESAAVSKATG